MTSAGVSERGLGALPVSDALRALVFQAGSHPLRALHPHLRARLRDSAGGDPSGHGLQHQEVSRPLACLGAGTCSTGRAVARGRSPRGGWLGSRPPTAVRAPSASPRLPLELCGFSAPFPRVQDPREGPVAWAGFARATGQSVLGQPEGRSPESSPVLTGGTVSLHTPEATLWTPPACPAVQFGPAGLSFPHCRARHTAGLSPGLLTKWL